MDETDSLAEAMKKSAPPREARSSDGFKREVRVIGGRKDGATARPSGNKAMVGLAIGAVIAAAGAAVWFLVLS